MGCSHSCVASKVEVLRERTSTSPFTRTPTSAAALIVAAFGLGLAEVDGNRTRLRWFTPHARFEGGGAHQALRHLHPLT